MAPGDRPPRAPLQVDVLSSGTRLRAPGLAAWLAGAAPATARGEVSVAIVPDAKIRALNREYRKRDYATDVLSFPAHTAVGGRRSAVDRPLRSDRRDGRSPADRLSPTAGLLGDIVIAAGVAARQARQAGHSVQTELRVLALHGLLHLLGYDHESPDDRGRMARAEKRLRAKAGLNAGLIERAPRAGSAGERGQ